jgi:2-C-methyl-D-erythritol 4-phosphate cytidylyltransferase/2-C-methyl-D-erythritol 2,4-cyclodiphosphate synthase
MIDVRLGNGFDVHAFTEGNEVTLCGIKIPFSKKLLGHSDADVGLHAITDAIYGAIAAGDIGTHFPPNDPKWEDASSDIFLKHAVQLANKLGYQINNVDCTIICEKPKIGPLSDKMKTSISRIMQLDKNRISVKATTSEKLGFIGREEGIAALATASVSKVE